MKTLNEELNNIRPTLAEQEPQKPTPQHGSISTDGNLTIHGLETHSNHSPGQELQQFQEKVSKPSTQPTRCSQKWGFPLSQDDTGKQAIASFMVDCFNALDTFGKTPDQIKSVIKMHLMLLGEYPLPLVRKAYLHWISNETIMPKPADIISLIKQNNGRLLSYIIRLRETGGEYGVDDLAYEALESHLGSDWKKYV